MKRRLAKLLRRLALVCLCVALALVCLAGFLKYEDGRHETFFQTGRSVNDFLKEYGAALRAGFTAKDTSAVTRLYSAHYRAAGRGRWVMGPEQQEGDVVVCRLEARPARPVGKEQVAKDLAAYFGSLASVSEVICKINLIESAADDHVVLTVKFILDGTDLQGAILQDRHFYRWRLVNEAPPGEPRAWRIEDEELVEGLRVAGTGRGFEEAKLAELGIDYAHKRDARLDPAAAGEGLKFGVIQHSTGGVAAVDYNNDGRPDLFFADGERCRLFRNDGVDGRGRPRFTDVTAVAGLDGIGQATAGLFADVDNDGHKDLFVVRYCAPCKFFHNNGDGTFSDRSSEMGLDLNVPATSACFLDYDRDGFVDLYVAVYGDAFRDIPRLPFFARNGGKNRLLRNVGGRRFEDVTDASGAGDTGWCMAVAAGDFNNDGYPDLAVANDFGRKALYRNNGDGTFTDVAKQAGVLDFSGGMGVAFADVDDDGYLDVYFANINSNQRWFGEDMTVNQYLRNVLRSKWLFRDFSEYRELERLMGSRWRELGKMVGKGNSLFRNNGDGTFTELTGSNTHRAGWGWGVAFFDMYNSTRQDIFAANGWISNQPGTDL
jgi:hypothetical protein